MISQKNVGLSFGMLILLLIVLVLMILGGVKYGVSKLLQYLGLVLIALGGILLAFGMVMVGAILAVTGLIWSFVSWRMNAQAGYGMTEKRLAFAFGR